MSLKKLNQATRFFPNAETLFDNWGALKQLTKNAGYVNIHKFIGVGDMPCPELVEMATKIWPVISEGALGVDVFKVLDPQDLTDQSYIWDKQTLSVDDVKLPTFTSLEFIGYLFTVHSYGNQDFFEPTAGEILSQIKKLGQQTTTKAIPATVVAYQSMGPAFIYDNLSRDGIFCFEGSAHAGAVALYTGQFPENIKGALARKSIMCRGKEYKPSDLANGS